MLPSACPHRAGLTRALKSEKSLSLPIPVGGGGGAVDTNDWCIITVGQALLEPKL